MPLHKTDPSLIPRQEFALRTPADTRPSADPAEAPDVADANELSFLFTVQPADALRELVNRGLDHVPPAASGYTLQRWRRLSEVAAINLSVGRLFEGHTDALAILAELNNSPRLSRERWGVWAAESRGARLQMTLDGLRMVRLNGIKQWCSGARDLTHALVTAWLDGDGPYLVRLAVEQPGVTLRDGTWIAVGMADTNSIEVNFDGARGRIVGQRGDYLQRPGFWHGSMGVAACWHGAATCLARLARKHSGADLAPEQAAGLGRIDIAIHESAATLRGAAEWIDANPRRDARTLAMRTRNVVERTSLTVLDEAGRVLGATAYCMNPLFARMAADLPVFLRQNHTEKNLRGLGDAVTREEPGGWLL